MPCIIRNDIRRTTFKEGGVPHLLESSFPQKVDSLRARFNDSTNQQQWIPNINLAQLGLLIDKMPLCDYKSYLKQFFKDQISLDLAIAREA